MGRVIKRSILRFNDDFCLCAALLVQVVPEKAFRVTRVSKYPLIAQIAFADQHMIQYTFVGLTVIHTQCSKPLTVYWLRTSVCSCRIDLWSCCA